MSMPVQKPGKSKQDYGTPRELISAVEERWGKLVIDLAATAENTKAHYFITPERNSLAEDWHNWLAQYEYRNNRPAIAWLNPPFADIAPWAEKCRFECGRGAKIIMLTPASIGANWFADHVYGMASVIALRPRLVFEGCKDPYPKDCMLTLWGCGTSGLFEIWKWK